jgi:hypothetical protein
VFVAANGELAGEEATGTKLWINCAPGWRDRMARRFTELVADPPMTFLAGWRMALAADLLRGMGSQQYRLAATIC